MKKIIFYINLLVSVALLSSCSDFLDRYPLDSVTDETFWKTEEHLKAASYPCYTALRYDFLINMSVCGDDIVWGDITSGLSKVSGGRHTVTDGFPFSSYWRYIYVDHMKDCNKFLDNYDKAEIDQNIKDSYAAEVIVLRATLYFYLTSLWGDVPLITRVITASDPEAYGPRNPRGDVIQFILNDLDWAASKLTDKIPTGEHLGRINKWGALAIKARIALQNEMWDVAEQAAKEIIDNGPYELYHNYGELYQLSGNIDVNPNNKETIISSMFIEGGRTHNMTNYTCNKGDYIRLNASKRLIDAYLCNDGKPAKAGLEYYKKTDIETSPSYNYPEERYTDYFQNRDPRLYMTLYCPGDEWPGGDDGDKEANIANEIFNLPRFAALQNNNRNGANTYTGFYFKKYNTPKLAGLTNQDYNNINVIRYAEILLIYAEALFNKQGKTLTQDQIDMTVNQLRDRVGMHRMNLDELKQWGLDLETELHRERRVEMSLDGMRYFDILRWKEGEKLSHATVGPNLRVCINDLGANPFPDNGVDEFGDIIFEKSIKEGGAKNFDPSKHYLWPVPYAELQMNEALGQNPGWK